MPVKLPAYQHLTSIAVILKPGNVIVNTELVAYQPAFPGSLESAKVDQVHAAILLLHNLDK